jgi:hypothetical protein
MGVLVGAGRERLVQIPQGLAHPSVCPQPELGRRVDRIQPRALGSLVDAPRLGLVANAAQLFERAARSIASCPVPRFGSRAQPQGIGPTEPKAGASAITVKRAM